MAELYSFYVAFGEGVDEGKFIEEFKRELLGRMGGFGGPIAQGEGRVLYYFGKGEEAEVADACAAVCTREQFGLYVDGGKMRISRLKD
jgi:hypothetical protein